jgi:hypothetical protein
MRYSSTAALAFTSIITGASALPGKRQVAAADIDPVILQYALTVSVFLPSTLFITDITSSVGAS